MKDAALGYAQAQQAQALDDLLALVAIPSVSTSPAHQPDMARAAQWVADYCQRIGLHNVAVMPTALHPLVYAEWLEAGDDAFTLLLYGHYDVQPADPIEKWHTLPFEPTLKGENLFARGASDDKGQFLAVLKAVEAYLQTSGRLPINVKVFIEGEEEISSPSMGEFIKQHQTQLACDAILICDHPMLAADTPMMYYGVRGNCYMQITVRGPGQDLHSGLYGGAVDNPMNVLARLLAQIQDGITHRILIPGFYDRICDIDDEEKALLNDNLFVSADILKMQTGVPAEAGETGYTLAERLAVRPTFEVCGIGGGFTGEGKKTVIPAEAFAKLSMRLVPDQDPREIADLTQLYLSSRLPSTVTMEVEYLGGSHPVVVDYRHPAVQAAHQAYQQVYGKPAVLMRGGGSLPLMWDFQQILRAPIVMMGMGLPDDNLHSPNEKFFLPNYYRGTETIIHYFDLLAAQA
jgi:acetylornithine deacetylase/succinyl-diaminopimelate desuccinylase-like protein